MPRDLGYIPLDVERAHLLYQVMSNCYEKRCMIVAINIEFVKWGTAFGDDKLMTAIIGRLVRHGRHVELNGTSKRMNAALTLGKSEG